MNFFFTLFFYFFFSSLCIENTTNLGITRAIYRFKTMRHTMHGWHYSRILNENEFHLIHSQGHTHTDTFHVIPYSVCSVLSFLPHLIRTHRTTQTHSYCFPRSPIGKLVNMRCIHLYSLNNERIKGIENEELTHRLCVCVCGCVRIPSARTMERVRERQKKFYFVE